MAYLGHIQIIITIISVQLVRRFLESRLYAITNWPAEFIDEYLPLLKNFDYNKGSLNQSSFNNQVYAVDTTEVSPLPPVHECTCFFNRGCG